MIPIPHIHLAGQICDGPPRMLRMWPDCVVDIKPPFLMVVGMPQGKLN